MILLELCKIHNYLKELLQQSKVNIYHYVKIAAAVEHMEKSVESAALADINNTL